MTEQHYHPCDVDRCAEWGFTAAELIEAAKSADDEGVFDAHRDGRDFQRPTCSTCGR